MKSLCEGSHHLWWIDFLCTHQVLTVLTGALLEKQIVVVCSNLVGIVIHIQICLLIIRNDDFLRIKCVLCVVSALVLKVSSISKCWELNVNFLVSVLACAHTHTHDTHLFVIQLWQLTVYWSSIRMRIC